MTIIPIHLQGVGMSTIGDGGSREIIVVDPVSVQSYHIVAHPRPGHWIIEIQSLGQPIAQATFRLADNPILAWILDVLTLHSRRP